MKFNIEEAIDGTIDMFMTGKRVIFPVFMEKEDREKLSETFAKLSDFYTSREEDTTIRNKKHIKLKLELSNLKENLVKKYKKKD